MAEVFNQYTGLLLGAEELANLTDWPDAVIEDYTSINTSLRALSQGIQNSVMIVGTGSPEGSVKANAARQYFDSSGAVGSRFYVNPVEGANTGWVAIN